ncbi:hypothetical protein OG785_04225 [Streptomyces sp. NBC_00006]|uniref:hypothetical protein n=1 Tax=Streptomyces sp. NBC_00006 TaxID=2975619 RepID=UPI0022586795|nr:hypothetical protein [Streptomyces sp. NBC_00006]MCX5529768.1 hypothetical protein [Streptomyces sp. NBC_00006]
MTESVLPRFAPEVLDPAVILTSVSEALLPVVEKELAAATERMVAALAGQGSQADLLSAFRAELMRRVLPQFTEAVRKGVLESIGTRRMHLSQLAVLHRQALNAKTLKSVLARLDDEAAKAGLQVVGDTGDHSLFNVVEEQPGVLKTDHVIFELVEPAYVDKESGKVIERGWLRAVTGQESPAAEAPAPKPTYRETLHAAVRGRIGMTRGGKR